MSKSKLQPGFNRFDFRPGIKGFPNMKGMNRQTDPGALPPNQFYHLQNVRCLDGQIVSRGGSLVSNNSAETGCITGMFDNLEPSESQTGLFISSSNPIGEVVRVGLWDGLTYSDLFEGDPNSGLGCQILTPYQGNPLLIIATKGYRLESGGTLTELFTLSGVARDAIEGYDGKLYIIIGDTELISWDGFSFTSETTEIEMSRVWSSATEVYLAGPNGGTPFIATQSGGWAHISWTGPAEATPRSRLLEAFGKAWVGWSEENGSQNNFIVSLTGSTMTVERNPSSHDAAANPGVTGLALLGSLMVYSYFDGNLNSAVLGTYDGATWTDGVKNLSIQPDIATTFIDDMTAFDDYLYVFEDGNLASPARDTVVIRCATVGGTWTADVVPDGKFTGAQNGPITQLIAL